MIREIINEPSTEKNKQQKFEMMLYDFTKQYLEVD